MPRNIWPATVFATACVIAVSLVACAALSRPARFYYIMHDHKGETSIFVPGGLYKCDTQSGAVERCFWYSGEVGKPAKSVNQRVSPEGTGAQFLSSPGGD